MGTRPLRQYYLADDGTPLTVDIDPALRDARPAWHTHRRRLAETLAGFGPDDWQAPTRCDEWSAREVIAHLVVVDGFWVLTLGNGLAGNDPTSFLAGFDPSSSTDALTADAAGADDAALLERFVAGTDALAGVVDTIGDEHWHQRAESPLGHLPLTLMLGHAFWDSWLHERDILEPVGRAPEIDPDELLAVTWFNLTFAGLQGGLPGDPHATAPGPDGPVDATVRFEELPSTPLRLRLDEGLRVSVGGSGDAEPGGTAIAFVEGLTGRTPIAPTLAALSDVLSAQVARAHQVL
jgi:uncharacterized protein (TIGR03083 family)